MKLKIVAMIAAIVSPGSAWAGQASMNCEIQAKSVCAPIGSATLSTANGAVLLSHGIGFSEVKAGTRLSLGDRVLVKQGLASVSLGPSCNKHLGANSMVTIVQRDGKLCAAALASDPSTVAQGAPGQSNSQPDGGLGAYTTPLAIVGAGGAILGIAALSQTGNRSGSSVAPPTISRPAFVR